MNRHASALGKLGKGIPKTITPQAKAARLANMATARAARKPGSCRFAAYYKVQWYDPASLCWRDVQKAHKTAADATAAFLPGKKCRVMEVSEAGRKPL